MMLSPEAAPFARTGGLGDVLGALPEALAKLGVKTTLLLPAYRAVLRGAWPLVDTGMRAAIRLGGDVEEASFLQTDLPMGNEAIFVKSDRFFDRDGYYGGPEGDYADNPQRFVLFCRAALEVLRQTGADVLHAHDWQSAMAIAFLRAVPNGYGDLARAKTVLTIHNAGYQGVFAPEHWGSLGVDWGYFTPQFLEFYGRINFMKGGAVFADAVTTVSPTYAEEIKTPEQGYGLEGVFQERAARLRGILNGADYSLWDPSTDKHIARRYSARSPAGKAACKEDLQRLLGLEVDPGAPLIGMVSRLARQKGFDLVEGALEALMGKGVQLAVLGAGERRYEDLLRRLPARYPGRAAARVGFDDALAHKIEAGADMFLMPSLYEPCGLNQMYSLRYGTIPIVRATGGLKDTVAEFDPAAKSGTGFLFTHYETGAMLGAVDRALRAYGDRRLWPALMRNAMRADFSWARSAQAYLDLYRSIQTYSMRS